VFDLTRRLLTLNTNLVVRISLFASRDEIHFSINHSDHRWNYTPSCGYVLIVTRFVPSPRSINENQEEKTSKIIRVANYLQNQNEIMFFADNRTLKILANFKRIKHGIILGANDQPRFKITSTENITLYVIDLDNVKTIMYHFI
jgi:hypothetical protein